MVHEPSVLLIDDMEEHYDYLRLMNLDADGWRIEAAIDKTVAGATREAIRKIEANDGFTAILVDILFPNDEIGGVKIIRDVVKYFAKPVTFQWLLISRGEGAAHSDFKKLADRLKIPQTLRSVDLITEARRERVKDELNRIWRRAKSGAQNA